MASTLVVIERVVSEVDEADEEDEEVVEVEAVEVASLRNEAMTDTRTEQLCTIATSMYARTAYAYIYV